MVGIAPVLERYDFSSTSDGGVKTTVEQRGVTHAASWVDVSQGATSVRALVGDIGLEAPVITTDALKMRAGGDVRLSDVMNATSTNIQRTEAGDGWFDKGSSSRTSYGTSTSMGAQIRSARPALMVSDSGMVDLRYVNIKAPQMVVEALQGGVFVGQGRNISDYAYSAQSASVFWQSQSSQSQRDETFMASQLPPMLMKAPVVRMERVRGETLAFLNQLEIRTDGGDAGRIEFADLRGGASGCFSRERRPQCGIGGCDQHCCGGGRPLG